MSVAGGSGCRQHPCDVHAICMPHAWNIHATCMEGSMHHDIATSMQHALACHATHATYTQHASKLLVTCLQNARGMPATFNATYMHRACNIHAMHGQHTRNMQATHTQHTSNIQAMYMQHTHSILAAFNATCMKHPYNIHVTCMQYPCNVHATCIQHRCHLAGEAAAFLVLAPTERILLRR